MSINLYYGDVISITGIGLDDEADISKIPDPVARGLFRPISASGELTYVALDLETTDLSNMFHRLHRLKVFKY